MRNRLSSLAAAAFLATGASLFSGYASALPAADATAVKNSTVSSNVEPVRWRRGWGFGAGLLGGAIIGGALAAPYYYGGPGPYYYGAPGPYYYGGPGPAYAPGPRGDAEDYCLSRYRSYDVRSGTYLGNDGYRHPCP